MTGWTSGAGFRIRHEDSSRGTDPVMLLKGAVWLLGLGPLLWTGFGSSRMTWGPIPSKPSFTGPAGGP